MSTISKFYFHDAASPNTGTMPSNSPAVIDGGPTGAGTEAAGASTARDATDVIGTANPDTESSITAEATQVLQRLGHRRFVSHPLAAHTFFTADGNWTFSYARSESNTSHNGQIRCYIYGWNPATGVGGSATLVCNTLLGTAMSATAETADSVTATTLNNVSISDGDILVFDVLTHFTQGMNTAYTDQFAYDGTTEASTMTCASFVTPPSALTLFDAGGAQTFDGQQQSLRTDPFSLQAVQQQAVARGAFYMRRWRRRRSGLIIPTPAYA